MDEATPPDGCTPLACLRHAPLRSSFPPLTSRGALAKARLPPGYLLGCLRHPNLLGVLARNREFVITSPPYFRRVAQLFQSGKLFETGVARMNGSKTPMTVPARLSQNIQPIIARLSLRCSFE
jgi:hypothetical protein